MRRKGSERDALKVIEEAHSVQGHGKRVRRFIHETKIASQRKEWRNDKIPFEDLKYDTLYLAANSRGSCYYIYLPSDRQVEVSGSTEEGPMIGLYWRLLVEGWVGEVKEFLLPERLNWDQYGRGQNGWVRKIEEVNYFRSPFLNWNEVPWGEIK